jgi:hypothetical protein
MMKKTQSRDKKDTYKALRHPTLIWLWIKGSRRAELSREHVKIHLQKVSKGRLVQGNCDPLNLISRAIDICSNSCYHAEYLYLVCQLFKPNKVVETGVHYGVSSAFILKALQETGGHLYSIDLPNVRYQRDNGLFHFDAMPSGAEPGFAVPEFLKSNWDLLIGDSRSKLPELLHSIGKIDVFHHDSAHVYELMMFEFEAAWQHLRDNGLLLADDADWNSAFSDFCKKRSIDYRVHRGIGIALKQAVHGNNPDSGRLSPRAR